MARDVARDVPWQELGLCAPGPGNVVDPLWTTEDAAARRAAVEICLSPCPVLERCRAEGLRRFEPSGVWGGLTERQRQSVRAGRYRAPL